MAFNFLEAKRMKDKAVMETFGLNATYKDHNMRDPVPVRARYHNKIERFGDLESNGYANFENNVQKVIFSKQQAQSIPVKRNGEVYFPDHDDLIVILETKLEQSSPDEEVWLVSTK